MKKMTCREMGGPCDAEMTAATSEEMVKKGMEHVEAAHPEMVASIKAMTPEENEKWNAEFNMKWAAIPEVSA
jgi:predicted small metal-binding protein